MKTRVWQGVFVLIISLFCALETALAQQVPVVTVTDDGFEIHPEYVYIVAGEGVYWVDDGSGPYVITGAWGSISTPGGVLFRTPGTYEYDDNAGNFGYVYVSANTPPSVAITNPPANATFTAPASFSFAADASDTDYDGLFGVKFYVGTNLVAEVTNSPFATAVTNLGAGSYTLTAIAIDNVSATTTNSITITVQNAAPIMLTALNLTAGQFQISATGLNCGQHQPLASFHESGFLD